MFSIKDKSVFITGGTSGIGLAVAERFVGQGARVAVLGRRDFQKQAEKRGLMFFQVDITDETAYSSAMKKASDAFNGLDVMIFNAGIENTGHMIEDQSTEDFRRILAVNLEHVYTGLKYGPGQMNDGGSIINTASVAGLLGLPTYAQYGVSKAGVINLTKSAALELAPRGIRVNAVCPGSIRTPLLPPDHPEVKIAEVLTPLGRIGETDDVIGLYQFLASDASRYITGQAISVDGGIMAGVSLGVFGAIDAFAGA